MKSDLEKMRDAAVAYRQLATCYRIGSRPTDQLFIELEKANKLLDITKSPKGASRDPRAE